MLKPPSEQQSVIAPHRAKPGAAGAAPDRKPCAKRMNRLETVFARFAGYGQSEAVPSLPSVTARWIPGHHMAIKAMLAGAFLVAMLLELITDPPRGALAWCFVVSNCVLIAAFPFSSRVCSLGLVLCFVAYYCVPTSGGGSGYWGVWLAMAYLGYAMRTWVVAGAVVLDGAAYLISIYLSQHDISGYVMFALVLAMVAFMGRCTR